MDQDAGTADTIGAFQNATGLSGDDAARYVARTWQIESGGNPNAVTGSQRGLGQWSPDLEAQYGINNQNRADPNVQRTALLREAQTNTPQLARVLGRDPTSADLYFAHQQGLGGATAHLTNPDAPAWQNMASTGEGRQKGGGWAKQAIWGNIPDNPNTSPNFNKTMFPGGVETVSSRDFYNGWTAKFNGMKAPMVSPLMATGDSGQPASPNQFGRFGGAMAMAGGGSGSPTQMPEAQQDQVAAKMLSQGAQQVQQQPQMQQAPPLRPIVGATPGGMNQYSPQAMAIRSAIQRLGGPGGGPPIGAALPHVPSVQERLVALLQKQRGMQPQQQQQG